MLEDAEGHVEEMFNKMTSFDYKETEEEEEKEREKRGERKRK